MDDVNESSYDGDNEQRQVQLKEDNTPEIGVLEGIGKRPRRPKVPLIFPDRKILMRDLKNSKEDRNTAVTATEAISVALQITLNAPNSMNLEDKINGKGQRKMS
jgi:hypothetical protein